MILLTGATGRVGRDVVGLLAAARQPFRAPVRRVEHAEEIRQRGGEAVVGDLDEPDTVTAAMAGVRTAFLLCPLDERDTARTEAFAARAAGAGVHRIVRMSGMGTGGGSDIPIARVQRDSEQAIERSGLAFTHLRPNTFMSSFLLSAPAIANDGILPAPAGGAAISFIDSRDVARVTATVLTGDGHDGQTYVLTGPQALDHHQVAGTIAAATGRAVTYVDIPVEIARQAMTGGGVSPWYADLYDALRTSTYWATVTSTVPDLTGHPARTFDKWVRENAGAFGPPSLVTTAE